MPFMADVHANSQSPPAMSMGGKVHFASFEKPHIPPHQTHSDLLEGSNSLPDSGFGLSSRPVPNEQYPIARPLRPVPFGRPANWQTNLPVYHRPGVVSLALIPDRRPVMGLLRQLLNGKYHVVADAFHVDAMPMRKISVSHPYMEVIEPSQHAQVSPPEVRPQETSEIEHANSVSSIDSLSGNRPMPQVPFDVLLQEFKDLETNIKGKPDNHEVTFASLYQNYMKLLEMQTTTKPETVSSETQTPTVMVTTLPTTPPTTRTPPTNPPSTPETERNDTTTIPTPTTTQKENVGNMIGTSHFEGEKDDGAVMWLPGLGPETADV